MSLAQRINDLAVRVATECKAIRTLVNGNGGSLSALTTTNKSSLVEALNELKASMPTQGALINDSATASATTWSSVKIVAQINAAISALTAGAPGALDTLDELAAALGDDANFAATLTAALANRVRVDTAMQGLTTQQQANARGNIGTVSAADIGNPETDFVATFTAGLL